MTLFVLAGVAAGVLQTSVAEPSAPSAIEHALVEFHCRAIQRALPGTDAYSICYDTQLSSLRQSFGDDLKQLSAAERRTLDAACGRMQETQGRDAYLACLGEQLAAVRDRRAGGKPVAPQETAALPSESPEPAASAPGPESDPAPAAAASTPLWIAGGLMVATLAGGAAFVAFKRRTPPVVKCRSCGADVPGAGDLCPGCRHEAAENRRRAAAERAQGDHADSQEQDLARRLAAEQDDFERREQQRLDEAARVQAEQQARLREELDRRQRAEDARLSAAAAAGSHFDPHAVLGVPADASPDAIRAAYEELKAKYADSEYAHLGVELQDHFRAKAQSVERAYVMLTTGE